MSWYFFGGFSAYLIVPSGRWRNQSGCSVDVRMIGRRLVGEVERDLEAVLTRRADEAVEIVDRAEPRLHRLVPARLAADRPRAAGIARPGVSELFGPLRKLVPIGWIGGR